MTIGQLLEFYFANGVLGDMLPDVALIPSAGGILDIQREGVQPECQPIRKRNIRVTNKWRDGAAIPGKLLVTPFFCFCSLFEILADLAIYISAT